MKVELSLEQCSVILKLLNACGPLVSDKKTIVFQSRAARARYEAGLAILIELQRQFDIPEIMDTIESIEEV